jgi:hypothetical protein
MRFSDVAGAVRRDSGDDFAYSEGPHYSEGHISIFNSLFQSDSGDVHDKSAE